MVVVVVVMQEEEVLAVADVFFSFGWLVTVIQSWWRLRNLDSLSNLKHLPPKIWLINSQQEG